MGPVRSGDAMKVTRRTAIGLMAAPLLEQQLAAQAATGATPVTFLDGAPPAVDTGISFGVPWPRGSVRRDQTFSLTARCASLAVAGVAAGLLAGRVGEIHRLRHCRGPATTGSLRLAPGNAAAPHRLTVTDDARAVQIDTGRLQAAIPKEGANFLESITMDGRAVARDGRLICRTDVRIRQQHPQGHRGTSGTGPRRW